MKSKTFFCKNNFSTQDIKKIRDYFEKKNFFNMSLDLLNIKNNEILHNLIFSKNLLKKTMEILGEDIYFINEYVIQKNNRTFVKEKYHKDSGKVHQSDILSDDKNMYGKIGIILQDNIKGDGGGIDYLTPLSYDNFSDRFKFQNKLRSLYYFIQDKLCDTQLYTKAGDFIYFSAMLSHRTSIKKKKRINLIPDKYIIYYQLTNFNTLKKVLKIVRSSKKDIEFEDLKNEITVIELEDGLKVKVLNKKISTEVGNYMGL